ncbi:MAG TPA: 3-dehydroquinate synthase [Tissierellales bacterium]|nr:3-dehydroquinate synthase [Tissierellales bacterium]
MDTIIGSKTLEKLPDILVRNNYKKLFIITDENVSKIYLDKILNILSSFQVKTYVLKPGEKSKRLKIVLNIYDELIGYNFNRNGVILSIGGGVVGDISGYVASTYMRGVNYIQIPTTLLAQVDSSIGGKVGVDYKGLKNIIGSFYFPIKTIIDVEFLKTLNNREMISGIGEVFKYGLIEDYNFFNYVKKNIENILEKNDQVLIYLVEQSVNIKKKIVKLDELDNGVRRKLNFGHTIGHSIEGLYNFDKYNHGEAVILGMLYESFISKEIGLIDTIYFKKIYDTLTKLITPIHFNEEEKNKMINIMDHDKKNVNNKIGFILPVGRGRVNIFYNIQKTTIKKALEGKWI